MKVLFYENEWHERPKFPEAEEALRRFNLEELAHNKTITETEARLYRGDINMAIIHVDRDYESDMEYFKPKYPNVKFAAYNSVVIANHSRGSIGEGVALCLLRNSHDFVILNWDSCIQGIIDKLKQIAEPNPSGRGVEAKR